MNAQADKALLDKLNELPPERRAEVEDFVDFLRVRDARARDEAASRLQDAFRKLDGLGMAPMSPDEVQREIAAARLERRGSGADRS